MPKLNRHSLLFSLNSFAAAMLALYIALAVGLPRPYWAMTTAYIISQPLSGAVRSRRSIGSAAPFSAGWRPSPWCRTW